MTRISQQFKKQFQFYNPETAFSLRIHQVFLKNGNYFKNSRLIMTSVQYLYTSFMLYTKNRFRIHFKLFTLTTNLFVTESCLLFISKWEKSQKSKQK